MALINHNVSSPNDGLGDELRQAFIDQNTMNAELYNDKADKVTGKDWSTNDFTNALKTKLDGIESGAQVNVPADWNTLLNKPEITNASDNGVVTSGGYSVAGEVLTVNTGWFWKIYGVLYHNVASQYIDVNYCASGNTRIDIILANQSGTFKTIQGVETTLTPITPVSVLGKLQVGFLLVGDATIGDYTPFDSGATFSNRTTMRFLTGSPELAYSLAEWNTFFGVFCFFKLVVSGLEVTLYGGEGLELGSGFFNVNDNITYFNSNVIKAISGFGNSMGLETFICENLETGGLISACSNIKHVSIPNFKEDATWMLMSNTTLETLTIPQRYEGTAWMTALLANNPSLVVTYTVIESIDVPSGGATDLAYTASPTNGTVISSTGTDATIPLANGTNAGLSLNNLSNALKTAYDGAYANITALLLSGVRLITPPEITKLSNTSGTNTGDQDLSGYVPTTRTVNTKALSSNVTLTTADIADSTGKRYQTENQNTFNDATSSIQTQLNLKNGIIVQDLTPSSAVTGTTTETLIGSYKINGGTYSSSDILEFLGRIEKTTSTGNTSLRLRLGTTSSFTKSLPVLAIFTNSTFFNPAKRTFHLFGGNINGIKNTVTLANDNDYNGNLKTSTALTPANDFWIFTSIQNAILTDSATQQFIRISK